MAKLVPLQVGERRDGVWRRSENVYVASIKISGRHHQRSFGDDYEAAVLYVERLRQERKLGQLRGENQVLEQVLQKRVKEVTAGEIIIAYANNRAPFLRPATIEFYQYLLTRIKPLATIPVGALTVDAVYTYIGNLKESGLSLKTIKEILAFCKSAFSYGVSTGKISSGKNVFEMIVIPKVAPYQPTPFTPEEIVKIFEHLKPRLRFMFWIQFATGIRSGELISLKFSDIDFEKHRIKVSKTTRHNRQGPTKTHKGTRFVFISPQITEELLSHMKERNASSGDPVFLNQYGKPYADTPEDAWKLALQKAGVPYRRPYTLRHTYASHALAQGVTLSFISETLGHANVNITAQKYLRFITDLHTQDEGKITDFIGQLGRKIDALEENEK
jgi:integrase